MRKVVQYVGWRTDESPPSTNSDWKIQRQKHTIKHFLISQYLLWSTELKSNPYKYELKAPTVFCYTNYCPVELHPENMVSLNDFTEEPNTVFEGKLFLCRTLTPSIKMRTHLMVVEVPDLNMKDRGAFLALFNYLHPSEEADSSAPILSPGTILVVKNPVFLQSVTNPYFSIRCDNPADVVILNETEFEHFFPGLEWSLKDFENDHELSFPCEKNTTIIKTEELKALIGNFRLEKKNSANEDQAEDDTSTINDKPFDLETLHQRCRLYLHFKIYRKSLEDSSMILLKEPFNKEAICNKAVSLIGLREYFNAIEFLKWHLLTANPHRKVSAQDKNDLFQLVSRADVMSKQVQFGSYDLIKMFQCPQTFFHDAADYIGDIKIEHNLEGKGRGIVATKNIKCGDLILAEKAFEIAFPDYSRRQKQRWILNLETREYRTSIQAKLVAAVAHRLIRDPEFGKQIYTLHDGTERCVSQNTIGNKEYKFVDIKRIDSICGHNSFHGNSGFVTDDNCNNADTSHGLWIFASNFNHNCFEANSRWTVCGDFLFVRACKNIQKGEEITLSYVACITQYPKRLDILSRYGFVCDCSLCLLDAKESQAIHSRRKEILTEIDTFLTQTNPNCVKILELIEELWDQRPNSSELNLYPLYPLIKLAQLYMKKQNYSIASELLQITQGYTITPAMNEISLQCCLDGIWCYLKCNKRREVEKLVINLKENLIREYGTDSKEVLNYVSPDVARAMREKDIEF